MKQIGNKVYFILATIFTIISAIMSVLVAFLLKMIIELSINKDASDFYLLINLSVLYIVIYFIISYIKEIFIAKYLKGTMVKVKCSTYQSIMSKGYQSFFKKTSGDYISILTNDMTMLEDNYYKSLFTVLHSTTSFVVGLISMFVISWQFAIGIIVIAVFFSGLTSITGKRLNELRDEIQMKMSAFTIKVKEIITGFEMIRSFNVQGEMLEEFNNVNSSIEDTKERFGIKQGITKVINENLVIVIFFLIMIMGSWLVINDKLVVGSLVAVVQLLNSIMNPINELLMTVNNIKSTKSIRDKIEKLINDTDNERITSSDLIEKVAFTNTIEVENLVFKYDNRLIINDISFELVKGKKYAIVGPSGCGKSTLLKLIQNYYNNYTGRICIDGIDYRDLTEESFFSLFSMTHQSVFIFSGSIKDNITLFNEYDEATINNAVKLAGLDKLMNTLPEGINTKISESGGSLSGGERQRISIARSLIKNTPVLVLDESTSALDKKTSDEIEEAILSIETQTCISVTHKLNKENRKLYDEIIHIDEGEISKIEQVN